MFNMGMPRNQMFTDFLFCRAQSALAVSGAVVGVVGRDRHSLATTTLTTEAQIVHSEQGSESRCSFLGKKIILIFCI